MTATSKYQRYGVEDSSEHDSLKSAMWRAFYDREFNLAYHYEILCGGEIYGRSDMLDYWERHFNET